MLADGRVKALSTVPDLERFARAGRNFLLTGHVMAVAFSGDGRRFATADPYGFAVVFQTDDPDRPPTLVASQSTGSAALAVALSSTGGRLAVAATATLTVVHVLGDREQARRSADTRFVARLRGLRSRTVTRGFPRHARRQMPCRP